MRMIFRDGTTRAAAALCALAAAASLCGGCGGPHANAPAHGILLVTLAEGSGAPCDVDAAGLSPLLVSPVSSALLPSAASALTGLLPPEHGLRVDGVGALRGGTETLASKLSARGYACAAFLSDGALSGVHGLAAGFSVYSARPDPTNAAARCRRTSRAVCDEALEWLAARRDPDRPVFLWLHLSPFGGAAPTWAAPAAAPAAAAPAPDFRGFSDLVAAFDRESSILVVPLFESTPGEDGGPRTFDPPGTGAAPVFSIGWARAVRDATEGVSAADVPWLLGAADARRPSYWESLVPWYAFRLPPLAIVSGGAPSPRLGLGGPPVPQPLATQSEAALLRAAGHLGAGLIPPLPDETPVLGALSPDGDARIARWRAALASTNRLDAARHLVETDPDVPLFHELLGAELMAAGDLAGACNAYAEVSRLGYNMVRANRTLSRLHAALGNVPAAIDRAEAAFLAGESDPVTRRELAELLLRTGVAMGEAGETRAAGDCIDRVLLLEPANPAARFESARLHLRVGDTNAAVALLRHAVRDTPRFSPAARLLEQLEPSRRSLPSPAPPPPTK